jgi:hypothetical protein
MRKTTAAAVGFVVLLAVVAGLYASGPKYVRSYGQTVSILCLDGRMANFVWEPAPVGFCESKRNGTYRPRGELIRRTTVWERIKWSFIGSALTESAQGDDLLARQRTIP